MPTSPVDPIHQIPPLSERLEHYRVPEGYFENLSDRILSHIPLDEDMSEDSALEAPRRVALWVRLRPWLGIAAVLIAVVALWGVWQSADEGLHLSGDEVASSAYDLSVMPLTDDEYADYLYETYVEFLVEEDAIGASIAIFSESSTIDEI